MTIRHLSVHKVVVLCLAFYQFCVDKYDKFVFAKGTYFGHTVIANSTQFLGSEL